MDANWIALAIGITGVMIIIATSRLRRHHGVNLGSVSHQWMAEQRLGREYDRQR